MDKMKPCPFCGHSSMANVSGKLNGKDVVLSCPKCELSSKVFDNMEEALVWWNSRHYVENYIETVETMNVERVEHFHSAQPRETNYISKTVATTLGEC